MTAQKEKPLSPHLQIYKPQMTSVMSILHRMTGVALAIGTLMVSWALIALASGPSAFEVFTGFAGSPLGLIMLFGWSVALYYHLCNGIRHLFWDMGYLFKLKNAFAAGYGVLIATGILTAATWWCALAY
jgi:succinate dehydrogenase / fumarate reductase cytochrome b subunit